MRCIDGKRVVTYHSADELFKVSIVRCADPNGIGLDGYDVTAEYNGVPAGSIFIDRTADLTMLSAALDEYIEARGLNTLIP